VKLSTKPGVTIAGSGSWTSSHLTHLRFIGLLQMINPMMDMQYLDYNGVGPSLIVVASGNVTMAWVNKNVLILFLYNIFFFSY
jgi:hypothetical protein